MESGDRTGRFNSTSSISAGTPERFALRDCLLLILVTALSSALYIPHLGFYCDDWAFLSAFHFSPDQSFGGRMRAFVAADPDTLARPVQVLYDAALYQFFGLQPAGYHIFNTGIFVLGLCASYFALKALTGNRVFTLAVVLLYGSLPHYSTDRFWYAAFQANISMMLYFVSLFCSVRQLTASRWGSFLRWELAASASLIGSALAYEVFMPLLLLNPILIFLKALQPGKSPVEWDSWRSGARSILLYLTNPVLLGAIVLYKHATSSRGQGVIGLWILRQAVPAAVKLTFGYHGLTSFHILRVAFANYLNLAAGLTVLALLITISAYLMRACKTTNAQLPSSSWLIPAGLSSLLVSGLSYAYFLDYFKVSTGINNRVAIAASVGVAFSLAAICALPARAFLRGPLANYLFCAIIGLLCGFGYLINNSIALFWIDASARQRQIIHDIRGAFIKPPHESSILLRGFCSWTGPGIVFEDDWDVTGALRIAYGDNTIKGDVLRPWMNVSENAISYKQGRDYEPSYPLDNLYLYDIARKELRPVADRTAALRYMGEFVHSADAACLGNKEAYGAGIPIW